MRDSDSMDRDFHALEGTPPPRVRRPAGGRAKAPKPSALRRFLIAPLTTGLATAFLACVRRPGRALVSLAALGVGLGVIANALYLQPGRHPAPLFAGAGAGDAARAAQQAQAAANPHASSGVLASSAPVALPPISTQRAQQRANAPLDPQPMTSAPAALQPTQTASTPPAQPRQQTNAQSNAQTNAQSNVQAQANAAQARAPQAKPADPIGALIRGDAPAVVNASLQPTVVSAADPLQARRILATQRALDRLGFQVASDGVLGPGTRAAIQRFERERDLPVTGDLSPRTLRALAARSGVPIP